jgi:hypothetical protein
MADDKNGKANGKTLTVWLMGIVLLALLCVAAPALFPALSWMQLLFPFGAAALPVVVMIFDLRQNRAVSPGGENKQAVQE